MIPSVLRHIRSTFEDPHLLDSLPLESAGNPSAWHAWRAFRGLNKPKSITSSTSTITNSTPTSPKRDPSEWKWDGVWESRVAAAVEASCSDAALFGSNNTVSNADMGHMDKQTRMRELADRQIRFTKMTDGRFEDVKRGMLAMGEGLADWQQKVNH
jgi:hypothetical protein